MEQLTTILDSSSRIHKTVEKEGGGGRGTTEDGEQQQKEHMWRC